MKTANIAALAIGIIAFCSCSTPQTITYFQDLNPGETELKVTDAMEIRVQPKDKLSIIVNAQDSRLTNLFNLPIVSQQVGAEGNTGGSRGVSGYTVDTKGNIDFPVLGKIRVQGMTREKVGETIKAKLMSENLVKDPVVTVEFMNLYVSVLGEVSSPGRYSITKDNTTILDALSMAGDLTIYGKREKVMVLRSENGAQHVYGVNLCSGEDIYSSPVYYLQQDDVVYVEPNDTRKRQGTASGNTVLTPSFWMSLASLLTTIAVLIVK